MRSTRNSKRLSLEDVRRKSGGELATSYISRIENNQVDADAISVGKLLSLAKGLGEPIERLFRAAAGIPESESSVEDRKLLYYAQRLGEHRKTDLIDIAAVFYANQANRHGRPKIVADVGTRPRARRTGTK